MLDEYISPPADRENLDVHETKQLKESDKKFRPRRAKWACHACHKRKVRCDALNHGTPCTNCKLDMKECVATPRKRQNTTVQTLNQRAESRESDMPLPPRAIIEAPQKRKIRFPDPNSHSSDSKKRQRLAESSSNCGDDEVARWMEMMPPSVLGRLEDISSHKQDSPDKVNLADLHHKCSEKLLQVTDILTDVISMHNSISAHLETSDTVHIPKSDDHHTFENQLEEEMNYTQSDPYLSDGVYPTSEGTIDITSLSDESIALTPESLEYVSESNFNIWLDLNNFDLDGLLSMDPYSSGRTVI
ncbi:hypothetical protein N7475_008399 [Penicillium sp. IBT 31633x]|nr:hypothetical protein N7475_008399 [Penicillium sp. IBT 31633x]